MTAPRSPGHDAGPQVLKLFFDGGCRPNPGEMEVAVVARGRTFHKPRLGHGTNDEAEWLALLYALEVAATLGAQDLILIGDSALVVNQASGAARCRSPRLMSFLHDFRERRTGFNRVRLRHVGRHRNLAGIVLDRINNDQRQQRNV